MCIMATQTMPLVYEDIEAFHTFSKVADPAIYQPLPDDWQIAVSDVVRSRDAVAAGRYRAVNMAGVAVISALTNALDGKDFPFVFAGDGARLAVPPDDANIAREAMAKTAIWAKERLGLDLRIGMTTVGEARSAGYDVVIARYAASPAASYAMFSGGGLEWTETKLKEGSFQIDPAAPGAMPDLSGLSCQWGPIASRSGVILSLIVKPSDGGDPEAFAALSRDILALLERSSRQNPVPPEGPSVIWPADRLALQATTIKASRGGRPSRLLKTVLRAALAWIVFRAGRRLGEFDPGGYRRQMAVNTDYQKYDDGLIMTVDCPDEVVRDIEERLERARRAGLADYGLHRQETALMTCVAPSIHREDHLHFLDGGGGGYTQAARQMKTAQNPHSSAS